ncbi:hypothetical protein DFP73DRAFT_615832 [Morchella snyderi]|nr:hypothetical protein DFP73DRAFT_615832 [Morchella snyderi]
MWQPFKLSFQGLEEELARQQKLVEDAIELAREEVAFKTRQEMSLFRREGRNHHLHMIQNHAENQSTNSTITKRLDGILNSFLQQNVREKMVKRISLLEAISGYDYRFSLSNACEKRHKNTGFWIFEGLEYKEWNEGLESSGLWCYGIRKTIPTAGMIDHLFMNQQNMTTSINYFFCDFSVEESLRVSTILKSLIKQILSVFEKIPPEMERNFEIPHTSDIVIDGLDECRADDRKRFLTYMNRLMKDSKRRIKIIVSSREKVDISRYLADFKRISLYSAVNNSDIKNYIRETIEEKLKDVDPRVGPGMVEEINDALIKGFHECFFRSSFKSWTSPIRQLAVFIKRR